MAQITGTGCERLHRQEIEGCAGAFPRDLGRER